MRTTIVKRPHGKFEVWVKRTRREEKAVKPIKGIPLDQLGDAIARAAKETRGEV